MAASITFHTCDLPGASEMQTQLRDALAEAEGLTTIDDVSRWMFREIGNPRLDVETLSAHSLRVSIKRRAEKSVPIATIHI